MIIVSQLSLLLIFFDLHSKILKNFNNENGVYNFFELDDDIKNNELLKYGEFYKEKFTILCSNDIIYENKNTQNFYCITFSKFPKNISLYYKTLKTNFLFEGKMPRFANEVVIPYNFFKNKNTYSILNSYINIKNYNYKIVGIGGISKLTNLENFFLFHTDAQLFINNCSIIRRFYLNNFKSIKQVQNLFKKDSIVFKYNSFERLENNKYIESVKTIMNFLYFLIMIPLVFILNFLVLLEIRHINLKNKKFFTITNFLGLKKNNIILSLFIEIFIIFFITYLCSIPPIITLTYFFRRFFNAYFYELVTINYKLIFLLPLFISVIIVLLYYLIILIYFVFIYKKNDENLRL